MSCHFNFGEIVHKNLNTVFNSCGVKITLQYFGFRSSIVLKNKEIYRKYHDGMLLSRSMFSDLIEKNISMVFCNKKGNGIQTLIFLNIKIFHIFKE